MIKCHLTEKAITAYQILQTFNHRGTVEMISSKNHRSPSPLYLESNTRDCMKRISEVECCTLEFQRLSDNGRSVAMRMSKEGGTQPGKCSILSNKRFVNSWRSNDGNSGTRHNFLESAGIMICMTVRNNNSHDHLWPNTFSF